MGLFSKNTKAAGGGKASPRTPRTASKETAPVRSYWHRVHMREPGVSETRQNDDETEKQQRLLSEFRVLMDTETTPEEMAFCTDDTLWRYLRARNYNLTKAHKMLVNTLKWRHAYKPAAITAQDISGPQSDGTMYLKGFCKSSRTCCLLRVYTKTRRMNSAPPEHLKLMVYVMERAFQLMEEVPVEDKVYRPEKMTWLVDCKGYNLRYNGNSKFALDLLNIVQNHYPERLGNLLIIDPPFLFYLLWKGLKPLIDPNTVKKIVMVHGSAEKKRRIVQEHMDPALLEKDFAGDEDFKYDHAQYIEWMSSLDILAREKHAERLGAVQERRKGVGADGGGGIRLWSFIA